MLSISFTPSFVGFSIRGDYNDFESLYDCLHNIVGDEDEFPSFEGARMRVLALCYDLRHAMMGDREHVLVHNGMDRDKMKYIGKVMPENNVYLECYTLVPEMLFILMALNDFAKLRADRLSRDYRNFLKKEVIWHIDIAQTRLFQALVYECLQNHLEAKTVSRMMNMMIKDFTWLEDYMVQNIDIQDVEFIKLAPEERLKHISITVKRLTDVSAPKYKALKAHINEVAREYGAHPNDMRLELDEPEIDW